MALFDFLKKKSAAMPEFEIPTLPAEQPVKRELPQGNYIANNGMNFGTVYAVYDGETNQGEFGPPKAYVKDWYTLRYRSKQLYIESMVAKGIVNKFVSWVIGDGLTPFMDPLKEVLQKEGITLDSEAFNKAFEQRWKAYATSRLADYTGKSSLLTLQKQGYLEGKLGGDVLVILRVIDGLVKIQHIDGAHVGNPATNVTVDYVDKNIAGYQGNQGYEYIYIPTGNRIRYGVEIDKSGMPVAYHVRVGLTLEFERVKARDSNGFLRAYMYYGKRTDLDAPRGSCLLEAAMENLKKHDRYFGAVVNGAENRAKFAVFFEHGKYSEEEDPLAGQRAKSLIAQSTPGPLVGGAQATDIAIDAAANKIASDVSVTMNGTFVNLPKDTTANSMEPKQELAVKDFNEAVIDIICMGLEIPPNVAMGKYNDSFSASRMAGKEWEHTFMIDRADFAEQYLNPIKELQLWLWVLDAKIQAPGFLQRLKIRNEIAVAAYYHNQWRGDGFPDIDPLKTANALRVEMGAGMEHMPLRTPESAAKVIGQGEYDAILKQTAKEKDDAELLGIEDVLVKGETIDGGTDEGKKETGKPQPKKKAKSKKSLVERYSIEDDKYQKP